MTTKGSFNGNPGPSGRVTRELGIVGRKRAGIAASNLRVKLEADLLREDLAQDVMLPIGQGAQPEPRS